MKKLFSIKADPIVVIDDENNECIIKTPQGLALLKIEEKPTTNKAFIVAGVLLFIMTVWLANIRASK